MDNYTEIKDPENTTELWVLLDRVTDIVTDCIYHGIATDGCHNNIDIIGITCHLSRKLDTLAELREVMAQYFHEYDSVETEAPGEGSHRAGSCHN